MSQSVLTASPFSLPLGIHLRTNIGVPNDHNSCTVCWKHLRALKERRLTLRKSNKSHLKTIHNSNTTHIYNTFKPLYIFMRGCQIVNGGGIRYPLAHPTHGKRVNRPNHNTRISVRQRSIKQCLRFFILFLVDIICSMLWHDHLSQPRFQAVSSSHPPPSGRGMMVASELAQSLKRNSSRTASMILTDS